jgi:hypothetical protein
MTQQQMIQCPRCGRTNSISQQFCGTCGERIQYISPVGPVGPAGPIVTVTPATPADTAGAATPGTTATPADTAGAATPGTTATPADTAGAATPGTTATPADTAGAATPGTPAAPTTPSREIMVDASQAQMAVTKYLERAYMNYLKEVQFTKCWYSHAGSQSFWDVEGFMLTKKKISGSSELHFRFQVDPTSGEVLGYEL